MTTADDIFEIQKELFAAYPPNTFGRRAVVVPITRLLHLAKNTR
jgi:hypothetical protein